VLAPAAAAWARPRGCPNLTIGVCASADRAADLHAGGAAYVEVSCRQWLVPDKPREAFEPRLRTLREAPVPARAANGFLPGSLPCVGPRARHEKTLAYAEVVFRRAQEVGIDIVTFGSGGARRIPEGWPREDADVDFVALLARMGPLAERYGVTVCVEPLQQRETNMINRVSEAHRLVKAVQHPNVAITADLFHMMREREDATSLRRAGALIRHVHVAEKGKRTPPGTAGDDFTPYLQALCDIGYEGLTSIECRWDDLPGQLPRGIETLRRQTDTLTRTLR
jgi:sugar phosphate isomerase/epimerase